MRYSPLFAIASCLACIVFALPVTSPGHLPDSSLSNRKYPFVARDFVLEASLLLQKRASNGKAPARPFAQRNPVISEQRKANDEAEKNAKAVRVAAAKAKAAKNKGRPANAKVTFGEEARTKLDALGLHGKSRKHAKAYHKKIMKIEMAKNPEVATGRVFHLAHEGGSDPNEKNHITAGFFKSAKFDGEQIKSPWALKKEAENPGKLRKGLFHFYPENYRFKAPKAFTAAAAESQARQKAAAAKAQAAAKAEEERIYKEKQARAAKLKMEGQRLSEEGKKTARKAKKNAKKGLGGT